MSRRIQEPHRLISATSMATSITSEQAIIEGTDIQAIEVEWTGTSPVGTVTVEVSSYDKKTQTNSTWKEIVFTNQTGTQVSTMAVSGNSGSHLLHILTLGVNAMRVKYNRTSGTGSLTVILSAKSIGA